MGNTISWSNWDLPWWIVMVTVGALNLIVALFLFFRSFQWSQREPHQAKYFGALRILGLIFVTVAFYRCIFVSSYPDRLAWFDTIWNSPFIIRSLAFFAELSFISMIAVILLKLNKEIALHDNGAKHKRLHSMLTKSPFVAVGCIFLAQFFAFAGLITQYLRWFAIEESLWTIAFLSILPLILVRLAQMKKHNIEAKSYRIFLILMAVWCIGYSAFQCYMLPFSYFANLSQDAGKIIPPDALRQAILGFTATHDYKTWGGLGFFIWHSGYFTICAWMALFFMSAPRIRKIAKHS